MPKVTVLVAVYNAAPFLQKCIDSLFAQSMADFQAICIDDCSTDESLSVLQDYAEKDGRIEVLHLEKNHGQAFARNEGLKKAKGEYVCMLDADDWFSSDALQQAVAVFEKNEETDCVLFDVCMDYADRSEPYEMPVFEYLTGEEAFDLSLTWEIHGLYMVRAAIHKRYPFDDTCKLYSDDNTTRLHYINSRQVRRCSGVYHYRQHALSATHAISVRRFDYLRANESMRKMLLDMQAPADAIALYENHRWFNLVDVYMFYHVHGSALDKGERRYGLEELKRVWRSIDRSLLLPENTHKFGYYPMSSWPLFRFQEWLYFSLRAILGRNH